MTFKLFPRDIDKPLQCAANENGGQDKSTFLLHVCYELLHFHKRSASSQQWWAITDVKEHSDLSKALIIQLLIGLIQNGSRDVDLYVRARKPCPPH
jgi:hypothetical protein